MVWYTDSSKNKVAVNWVSSLQSITGFNGGCLNNVPGDSKSPYTTVLGWIESTIPVDNENYTNSTAGINTLTVAIQDQLTNSSSFQESVTHGYGMLTSGSILYDTVG